MKCCICGRKIEIKNKNWDKGHNAQPVKSGRCCDDCNFKVVIPARLYKLKQMHSGEEVKNE